METPIKYPKKGAGARLRDFYNKLRKPLSPKQRDEWRELLKKKDRASEKAKPKKIAKQNSDLERP